MREPANRVNRFSRFDRSRLRYPRRAGGGQQRRIVLAAAFGALLVGGPAAAYRFFSDGLTNARAPTSEYALRWLPTNWGAGATLAWEVAPDEDWPVRFDSAEAAVPYIERGAKAWSEIPTADISWEIAGVSAEAEVERKDGVNSIFVDANSSSGGYARLWTDSSPSEERRRMFGCDIALGGWAARLPDNFDEWDEDQQEDFKRRSRESAVFVFTHEFGHCLGLAHSGGLSQGGRWVSSNEGVWTPIHPGDPAMSYGWEQSRPEGLGADDVVGASLLRPASGYHERTGSISGTVSIPGGPIPFAIVWALPVGDRPLRNRVGVFSGDDGFFLIEGLDPGHYALMAQPVVYFGAHGTGPATLDDAIRGDLVRVEAGREAQDLNLTMQWGRVVRPPYKAALPKRGGTTATSISERWGGPCAGTRVRAERPYPADGPLWFSYDHNIWNTWWATTLTVEWPQSRPGAFDWAGPYRDWYLDSERSLRFVARGGLSARGTVLDVVSSDWRIESTGSVTRYVMEVAWPEDAEPSLRFRSEDDACDGEALVVCDLSGCELRQ